MSFWRKGGDTLHDGTILGAIAGALLIWGNQVSDWIVGILPESATTFAGDTFSLPIIFIGAGMVIGYIVDRV